MAEAKMKFNFENILPDPDSFWSAEEVKTKTKQSVSPKPRSSDSVSMESVTAAWKRDFANENYSEEEPNFSIIGQLIFEFEERTAIFEHDALMHREAAEHRALKWIEPRLKDAGIDPVFFNNIIEKDYEKRKSINSLPPQSISAA